MAGVPVRSVEEHLFTLVEKGYNVSVCDQLEDPAVAVGIVKRGITQIVTPGTLLDLRPGTEKNTRLLMAIAWNPEQAQNTPVAATAAVDLSNANAFVTEFDNETQLTAELTRLNIREIITNDEEKIRKLNLHKILNITPIQKSHENFDPNTLNKISPEHTFLPLFRKIQNFDYKNPPLVQNALAAILNYLFELQNPLYTSINDINTYKNDDFMLIDAATFQNLEIFETLRPAHKKSSLLTQLDECITPMGSRLLRQYLAYPLKNINTIYTRLNAVEELLLNFDVRHQLRLLLDKLHDLERLTTKIASQKAAPRDLHNIRTSLEIIPEITRTIVDTQQPLLKELFNNLNPCEELKNELRNALVDPPPPTLADTPIIKTGYNPELDRLKTIADSGQKWLLEYELKQKQKTGINSLKIKYQRIYGYFIEVTKANLSLVPDNYIRKQTLVNAERYYTPELKEYEEELLHAEDEKNNLELQIFKLLCEKINENRPIILKNAQILAQIDLLSALAHTAHNRNYVKPKLDNSNDIILKDARHPVVERTMPKDEHFLPTDLELTEHAARLLIITGPNMGGKSTIIRQTALITLMAQIGSYVPADEARIGIVDKIFSRIGASDNLTLGQSTFMVEMTETANILNNATNKSLIILDEIGRGTSTYDGLSLAWAVAEHIHTNIKARTLFATHYHELTELEQNHDAILNCSVAVKEWENQIIFLRKLLRSPANRSYGIQVAKLAGIPQPVIARAEKILQNLEDNAHDELGRNTIGIDRDNPENQNRKPSQPLLFGKPRAKTPKSEIPPELTAILDEIKNITPDTTTPIAALNLIYKWNKKLRK